MLDALQLRLNIPSCKTIVDPTHTLFGPVIAGGGAETEMVCVDTHPNGDV